MGGVQKVDKDKIKKSPESNMGNCTQTHSMINLKKQIRFNLSYTQINSPGSSIINEIKRKKSVKISIGIYELMHKSDK